MAVLKPEKLDFKLFFKTWRLSFTDKREAREQLRRALELTEIDHDRHPADLGKPADIDREDIKFSGVHPQKGDNHDDTDRGIDRERGKSGGQR